MFAAAFWILLCISAILVLNRQSASVLGPSTGGPDFVGGVTGETTAEPEDTGGGAGAVPSNDEAPDG
jgi:hypothetical protein